MPSVLCSSRSTRKNRGKNEVGGVGGVVEVGGGSEGGERIIVTVLIMIQELAVKGEGRKGGSGGRERESI